MNERLAHFIRFINNLKRPSRARNSRLLKERGENIDSFIIREVRPEDLDELAKLHVTTWNATYPGVRKPPTYAIREYQWREKFAKNDGSWFCYVVENNKGQLIGFTQGNIFTSDKLPGYSGQLNKIYLLTDYQRLGIGEKMIAAVANRFLKMGINSMVLFSEPTNPTGYFYEAMGGERLYNSKGGFDGAYGWKDLGFLVALGDHE